MLNFDVKRKINTLRDILVGKVPDPKAQVEQITIALIYKFMDDMDLEGMEFGGRREFFKEEYEKYAWVNIMQPENSGQQRANLYAEGIDKMSVNPNLPQLFRDIFRGAYVPYRDPETLNMFLKEINDFNYDHSEELGNAYEHLLSIMGSQGDAGQFRTPRHIIDMIVVIVNPQKTDSILDPACGTAGFLISSYKHILDSNRDKNGNSTLSADERKRLTENIAGYDISPDMVRLSRVNMYLHKFAKPQISEYDTLSSLDRWDETYDVIMANPPFMTPKGGIIPHNRYRVPAKRSEVLFVDYIAEHLNPTGKAGVIVPEGIVFQSANAYKALRQYLVEDNLLYAVISLPAGVFNPYSGVKTSILLFDKTLAKQKDEILFVKINNDGYDLGAQRREVKGSDIPEVIRIIRDYRNGLDVSGSELVTVASKKDVAEQDYILVGDRYKEAIIYNTEYPMVKIGDICKTGRGRVISKKDIENNKGEYPVYSSQTFHDGVFGYINTYDFEGEMATWTTDGANAGTVFYRSGKFNCTNVCGTLIPVSDNINLRYLVYVLNNVSKKYVSEASGNPKLMNNVMEEIKIPLPPLHIQEEIVKEIEGYQKIIDGAKQVVGNYKPTMKIDPRWELVKLGEVCDLQAGGTPIRGNEEFWNSNDYAWYTSGELNETYTADPVNYISEQGLNNSSARLFPKGSLLVGMYDTAAFKMSILDRDATFNQAVCGIKPTSKINMLFLMLYFSSQKEKYLNMRVGARQRNLTKQFISDLMVAVPPIEIQQQIIYKINEEMAIVEQNKRLIEIFEQKIKDKISEVWGE